MLVRERGRPVTVAEREAYREGQRARREQKTSDANPFPSGTQRRWWYSGWLHEDAEERKRR